MSYPFGEQKTGANGIYANFGTLRMRQALHEMNCFGLSLADCLFGKDDREYVQAALVTAYGILLPLGITP
jgi:hypothetical protein